MPSEGADGLPCNEGTPRTNHITTQEVGGLGSATRELKRTLGQMAGCEWLLSWIHDETFGIPGGKLEQTCSLSAGEVCLERRKCLSATTFSFYCPQLPCIFNREIG